MNEINYSVLTNDNICIDIDFNDELKTRISIGKGKNSAVFITKEEGDRRNVIKFPIEYLSLFKEAFKNNNTGYIKLIDSDKKYEEKYKHIDLTKINEQYTFEIDVRPYDLSILCDRYEGDWHLDKDFLIKYGKKLCKNGHDYFISTDGFGSPTLNKEIADLLIDIINENNEIAMKFYFFKQKLLSVEEIKKGVVDKKMNNVNEKEKNLQKIKIKNDKEL